MSQVRNLAASPWPNYEVLKHLWRTGFGVGMRSDKLPHPVTRVAVARVFPFFESKIFMFARTSLVLCICKTAAAFVRSHKLHKRLTVFGHHQHGKWSPGKSMGKGPKVSLS